MPRTHPVEAMPRLVESAPPCVLATIAAVRGSSPAPILSRMLVSGSGETVGTVGGGCLEAEVLIEAKKLRGSGGWRRVAFSLTEEDGELRMICGGTVEILLERIDASERPLFEALAKRHAAGQSSLLARVFRTGGAAAPAPEGRSRLVAGGEEPPGRILLGEDAERLAGGEPLPASDRETALLSLRNERAAWVDEGRLFLEPVIGPPRAVLFGGGHVSRAVAAIAREAGFRVTVVDDREAYVSAARFPGAECVVAPGFRDLAALVPLLAEDYLFVCSRGHQYDEEILGQLLRQPPTRYAGVIGSKRKHIAAEQHLLAAGIEPDRFRALHAPVGLDIGAVTPEEIAVAVVAQMISVRRRARSAVRSGAPPEASGAR